MVYRKKITLHRSPKKMIRAYALALMAVLVVACGQSDATGPSEPFLPTSATDNLGTPDPSTTAPDTTAVDPVTAEPPDTVVVIPPDPDTTTVVDTVPPPDTTTVPPPDTTTPPPPPDTTVTDTVPPPPPPDTATAPVVLSPTDRCSRPEDYVTFADPVVANRVRALLGGVDPITCETAATLRVFVWPPFPQPTTDPSDLTGVQNLTGLEVLSITFFGAAGRLDISPLAGLDNLTSVGFVRAGIGDLSPLVNLPKLVSLSVREQALPDISMLGDMEGLTFLSLRDTGRGNDLAPLARLTGLRTLDLTGNARLSDVGPLLANPGIGSGAIVRLHSTSVSCADIAALEAKGVTVQNNCLRISADPLPIVLVNQDYYTLILMSDGSHQSPQFTWGLAAGSGPLPPGLSLSTTGELQGRVATLGTWTFTVEVRDASPPWSRSAQRTYSLQVIE
jgi:hypothetical protein